MKKYFLIVSALAIPLLFTACLKDENVEDRVYGLDGAEDIKLIEILNSPDNIINLDYSTNDTTFNLVTLHAATAQPVGEDVTVALTLDPALVTDYNTEHGTNYEAPPSSIYTMGSLTVTIPRGSRDGYLKMTAKPSDISAGSYALGFRIASISNPNYLISENYKTVITRLSVKNRYDGVYSLRSRMEDWSVPYGIANTPWTWPASFGLEMQTSSANSVNMYSVAHGSFIHPALTTTGGATGFGGTIPRFVFDLSNNTLINVVNDAPPGGLNRTFSLNPSPPQGTNKYDPATKTIYAAFILHQPGRPDLKIYDTLTYIGPR